ncbi:MAG: hypothetical protein EOP02_40790 [Proteobacteria bacterium]|nr:MAG: hypothetical protein EOP02_40790 [Pseudomonadota bacterium]
MTPTLLNDTLCTFAESKASGAHLLQAFSGFQLEHTKHNLALLLNHIGRESIFSQYTAYRCQYRQVF